MNFTRGVAGLALAAVMLTGGCAVKEPGRAVGRAASTAAQVTSSGPSSPAEPEPCDDRTYSDPSIAFESSLADGARLEVGETGWLSTSGDAKDIDVSGDVHAVELTDKSAPTEIACGEVVSSTSWVEVSAVSPGTVELTLPAASHTIKLIVR